MEQFEQQLHFIRRIPNKLRAHCRITGRYIRARVIELLVDCHQGRYANVAVETDAFFERHKEIRKMVQLLMGLQHSIEHRSKKYPMLAKELAVLIEQIDLLDY